MQDSASGARDGRDILLSLQHELRTPTSAIVGYSRMLGELAPESLSRTLGRIQQAGERLLEKVGQLVTFERLEEARSTGDIARFGARLRTELGNELHVILGYGEVLQEVALRPDAERHAADVARILDATRRLIEVVERITRGAQDGGDIIEPGALAPSRQPPAPAAAPPSRELETLLLEERLLVVEDDPMSRDLMVRSLARKGFVVLEAENGREALDTLRAEPVDLVLLDIVMPVMDGFEVLERMKADESLRHVPVIVTSAMDDVESIVRCMDLGADDHMAKHQNPVLFDARLRAVLERKRLQDHAQLYLRQLQFEQERSDRLLADILPLPIAERLKLGEASIADTFPAATVVFCDAVGFTRYAARVSAAELVARLNALFVRFDDVVDSLGVEKLKTMGDAYMLVSGVPRPAPDHAQSAMRAAIAMLEEVREHNKGYEYPLVVRIGMHSGPVIAGVIGRKRFAYDVWGDTVNIASRMESHGVPGRIQVSQATYDLLRDAHYFEPRGETAIKGVGPMSTYLLVPSS